MNANIQPTQTAALDYRAQGIRVNAIAPGTILTHNLQCADQATRAQIASHVPLHRLGRPGEIAAAAASLCSDHASFINKEQGKAKWVYSPGPAAAPPPRRTGA
jgi:glucose 1-dehydrogenase